MSNGSIITKRIANAIKKDGGDMIVVVGLIPGVEFLIEKGMTVAVVDSSNAELSYTDAIRIHVPYGRLWYDTRLLRKAIQDIDYDTVVVGVKNYARPTHVTYFADNIGIFNKASRCVVLDTNTVYGHYVSKKLEVYLGVNAVRRVSEGREYSMYKMNMKTKNEKQ